MKNFKILVLVVFIVSCGNNDFNAPKSFFGKPNLQLVSESEVLSDHMAGLVGTFITIFPAEEGMEEFVISTCSGVKLSEEFILTANHCQLKESYFHVKWLAKNSDLNKFSFKVYGNLVRLIYDGDFISNLMDPSYYSPLVEKVFSSDNFDFAIWRVESNLPPPFLKFNKLATRSENWSLYSFPHGIPLAKTSSCRGEVTDVHVYHNCDSLSGSSGGLVVGGLYPLALHQQGPGRNSGEFYKEHGRFEDVEEFKEKSACGNNDSGTEKECNKRIGMNRATRLDFILELVRNDDPLLYARISEREKK